jgi:hypothetical protein
LTIQTLFKPDGPLASHIDGFKARAPQLEMAEAVARAISGGRCWWRRAPAPARPMPIWCLRWNPASGW